MELTEIIEEIRGSYLVAMRASEKEDFDIVFAQLDKLEELMDIGDKDSIETAKFSVYFQTLGLVLQNRLDQLQESTE
jgi:hypothetical protein